MNEMVFFMTIVDHRIGEKYAEIFRKHKVRIVLNTLGRGTASDETLSYLGLGDSEKNVILSLLPSQKARILMGDFIRKMNLDIPGNGIAFSVPVKSVCGRNFYNYAMSSGEDEKGGEKIISKVKCELIVVVANRGYVDQVMTAARSAKAGGGTSFHASGTGTAEAEKFFGVTLAEEKDIVFIVAESFKKADIMKAITTQAGIQTEAGAIVFSLPICDVAGIRTLEEFLPEDET